MNFPKNIFTTWLNHDPIPERIAESIETHKSISGWKHTLITLENMPHGIQYLEKAIAEKKWVKMSDYLRAYYLYKYGGIYLDADIIVKDNLLFDRLVDTVLHPHTPAKLICERADRGWISSAFIGSYPGNPVLRSYMDYIETTTLEDYWDVSIAPWTKYVYLYKYDVDNKDNESILLLPCGELFNENALCHYGWHGWISKDLKGPLQTNIITIWISDKPTPQIITDCIESHNVAGWQHILYTIDNFPKDSPFIADAVAQKRWARANYITAMITLREFGGIYLAPNIQLKDKTVVHYIKNELMHPKTNFTLVTESQDEHLIHPGFIAALSWHYIIKDNGMTLINYRRPFVDDKQDEILHGAETWTSTIREHKDDKNVLITQKGFFINDHTLIQHET